jgi:hypothetical protein
MQINIGICQPAATNPTFTTDASGWTDCISTGQPESNTENVYGGTSSTDKVVEVDNGDAFGLCQTISGFTVGNTYTLYMLVSRRTSTGAGGSKYAPATVGLLVDIGSVTDASVTRNNTIYGYSQVAITFTATATSLPLRVDPDPSYRLTGFLLRLSRFQPALF